MTHLTYNSGAFMYGNVFENDDKQMDQQTLPRLFGALSEDFSVSRTNFNKDSVKAGTARRVLGGLFPKSYTLEVSFFHYQKELRSIPYDTKSFKYVHFSPLYYAKVYYLDASVKIWDVHSLNTIDFIRLVNNNLPVFLY